MCQFHVRNAMNANIIWHKNELKRTNITVRIKMGKAFRDGGRKVSGNGKRIKKESSCVTRTYLLPRREAGSMYCKHVVKNKGTMGPGRVDNFSFLTGLNQDCQGGHCFQWNH